MNKSYNNVWRKQSEDGLRPSYNTGSQLTRKKFIDLFYQLAVVIEKEAVIRPIDLIQSKKLLNQTFGSDASVRLLTVFNQIDIKNQGAINLEMFLNNVHQFWEVQTDEIETTRLPSKASPSRSQTLNKIRSPPPKAPPHVLFDKISCKGDANEQKHISLKKLQMELLQKKDKASDKSIGFNVIDIFQRLDTKGSGKIYRKEFIQNVKLAFEIEQEVIKIERMPLRPALPFDSTAIIPTAPPISSALLDFQ